MRTVIRSKPLYAALFLIVAVLCIEYNWTAVLKIVLAAAAGALVTYLILVIARRWRAAPPPVAVVPGGLERTAGTRSRRTVRPAELPPPGLLIGRDAEIDRMSRYLAGPTGTKSGLRIIVLSGDSGVGKTALAVGMAHLVVDDYPDGQLLFRFDGADGVPQSDPLATFVQGLRGPNDDERKLADPLSWYRKRTRRRRLLIILDNVDDAEQIAPLLPAGRRSLVIIATTADTLSGLPAHLAVRVEPLAGEAPAALLDSFVGAGRVAKEPAPAARLLAAAAGYPVAISIAGTVLAVRRNWTLETAVKRMTDCASVAPRDRAAVPYSGILDLAFAMLTREEAEALVLLGLVDTRRIEPWVLATLLSSATHRQVSSPTAGRLLDRLAQARFTQPRVDDGSGLVTYRLARFTRAYAAGRLAGRLTEAEQDRVRYDAAVERRLRIEGFAERSLRDTVYLPLDDGRLDEALAAAQESLAVCRDRVGAWPEDSSARIDAEEGLIRVALGEVLAEFGWIDAASAQADTVGRRAAKSSVAYVRARRLAGTLRRGQRQVAEADAALGDALAAVPGTGDPIEHVRVLRELIALQALLPGDLDRSRQYEERARELCRDNAPAGQRELPAVLLASGTVEQAFGEYETARRLLIEAEYLTAEVDHQRLWRPWIRLQRALLLLETGAYDQSREFSSTALAGFTALQHRYGSGHARLALGRAHLEEGRAMLKQSRQAKVRIARAVPMLEESHGTFRRCGDRWIMATAATALAEAYLLVERASEARRLLQSAKQYFVNVGDALGIRQVDRLLWEAESLPPAPWPDPVPATPAQTGTRGGAAAASGWGAT